VQPLPKSENIQIQEVVIKAKSKDPAYAIIKEAIKKVASNRKIDPAVKKRIKSRGFSLNDQDELLCNNLPVVFMENFFEKINEIHSDMGHGFGFRSGTFDGAVSVSAL
jgi:hypothetical protein